MDFGTRGQSLELMSCLLIPRLLLQGVERIFQTPTLLASVAWLQHPEARKIHQLQISEGFPAIAPARAASDDPRHFPMQFAAIVTKFSGHGES